MSNWFFKLFTIGMNKVNEAGENAVEKYIDIQREGKAVVESKKKLIESRQAKVVKSQTFIQLKKSEIESKRETLERMNLIAEKALAAGEEGDARQALIRAEGLEGDIEVLKGIIDELQPIVDESIEQISEFRMEISRIEMEIQRLDHIYEGIKQREELAGGLGNTGGAFDMESLRTLVNKAKATSEAKEVISEKTGANLDKKYSNIKAESSVEDRLSKLKEKIANEEVKSSKKK